MTKRPVQPKASAKAKRAPKSEQTDPPLSTEAQDALAANLQAAAKAAGLDQSKLAREAGMSRTTVRSAWEGTGNTTLKIVERLARTLECKASDLLCEPPGIATRE